MSWLSKILPPKVQVDTSNKSNIPEGLWCKCEGCSEILYHTDLEYNYIVCPKCDFHHQVSARDRINMILEEENQVEIADNIFPKDVLNFIDTKAYAERLHDAQELTNENDALIVKQGFIALQQVVIASFDFRFIGGSMGSVVGEKFAKGVEEAIKLNCPFICIGSSGGARMQEGLLSLMQMAKTCAALTKLSEASLPFISVLTHPTMGGVSASFAFLGDIVIAEPGALIGFAGPRVIEQTVRETLPDGFQRSELLLEKGAIDMVVRRPELKATLTKILDILMAKN